MNFLLVIQGVTFSTVLRYCLIIVDDILLENEVTSWSPLGEDGSAVNIISANTSWSGFNPFAILA